MLNIKIQSVYDSDEEMYLHSSKTDPEDPNTRIHTFRTIEKHCYECGSETSSKFEFDVRVTNET